MRDGHIVKSAGHEMDGHKHCQMSAGHEMDWQKHRRQSLLTVLATHPAICDVWSQLVVKKHIYSIVCCLLIWSVRLTGHSNPIFTYSSIFDNYTGVLECPSSSESWAHRFHNCISILTLCVGLHWKWRNKTSNGSKVSVSWKPLGVDPYKWVVWIRRRKMTCFSFPKEKIEDLTAWMAHWLWTGSERQTAFFFFHWRWPLYLLSDHSATVVQQYHTTRWYCVRPQIIRWTCSVILICAVHVYRRGWNIGSWVCEGVDMNSRNRYLTLPWRGVRPMLLLSQCIKSWRSQLLSALNYAQNMIWVLNLVLCTAIWAEVMIIQ